ERDDWTRRSHRADRVDDRRRDSDEVDAAIDQRSGRFLYVGAAGRIARDGDVVQWNAGLEGFDDEMNAVQQDDVRCVAARCGAVVRYDRILTAGDRLHRSVDRRPTTITLWYHSASRRSINEGTADQEVRGRNRGARSRAEAGAAEGNQARARARRSARERGIRRGQG